MKKIVIVNKFKFTVFLMLIFVFGSVFMAAVLHLNSAKSCNTASSTYMVSCEDTLWSIAEEIAGEKDIRQVIYDIKKANSLESSELTAGTILKLPY